MAALMKAARRGLHALSLAFEEVEAWWEQRGLPLDLLYTPPHLQPFADLYSDPAILPSLFGLQHDENREGPLRARRP